MTQTVTVLGGSLEIESAGGGGGPGGGGGGNGGNGDEKPTHPIVLPDPPPGVWPPPTVSHPIEPAPPGTPPGMIWPSPGKPAHPIAPGGRPRPPVVGGGPVVPPEPGQPLPPEGGPEPGHPLPQPFWALGNFPGYGWYYVCVDPGLAFEAEPPRQPK